MLSSMTRRLLRTATASMSNDSGDPTHALVQLDRLLKMGQRVEFWEAERGRCTVRVAGVGDFVRRSLVGAVDAAYDWIVAKREGKA